MHRSFSPANANVRSFDAVILPFRLVMPSGEAGFAEGCAIGPPFVCYEGSGSETVVLQKLAQQLQRRPFVAPRPNQDVEHLTVLVDRPSQIHPTSANRDIHLVQMPLWVRPRTPSSQTSRGRRAKPLYPSPNCLVRHVDTPFSHELLEVAEAQVEPGIHPNRARDDRRWEVEVSITDLIHPASLTGSAPLAHSSL